MPVFDIEDEASLDKLATKMSQRKLFERKNKRSRRNSSTDGEGDKSEDCIYDDVSIEMLNEVKLELKKAFEEAVNKVDKKLDAAYGRIGANEAQVKKNKEKIEDHSKEIANLQNELGLLRQDSYRDQTKMKTDLENQTKDLREAKEEVKRLAAESKKLKDEKKNTTRRLIDLEARGRRCNLLFHNMKEEENENCIEKMINFINTSFNLNIDSRLIQRAHRLGAPRRRNIIGSQADRPRPIIVCFTDFKLKEEIRVKRHKYKGPIGISEDFPAEIRNARKSLGGLFKELKDQGHRVGFAYPCKLLKNGVLVKEVDCVDFA